MKTILFALCLLITMFMAARCSRTEASGASAEIVPAPMSGFTCFIIRDGDGTAVGGNCVSTQ
jgi:hypothetical protein